MSPLRSPAPFLLAALLAACGQPADAARASHPERLDGAWVAEFTETYSPRLISSPGGARVVTGRVDLLRNQERRTVGGFAGVPTHFGTYSADLAALGLTAARGVPSMAVRLGPKDSVQIAFDPSETTSLVGSGALAGDSIAGTWRAEGGRNAGGSGGRFVLRRPH